MLKSIGILLLTLSINATAQKRLSEGTIVFDVQISNKVKEIQSASLFTQQIKGSHYRDEMVSSIGRSTTIFDIREGSGAILKEYGGQKIMIPMVSEQWEEKLNKLKKLSFSITEEKKIILGFECQKAEASASDGSTYTVFFTQELSSDNKAVDLQFSQLGGFTLEYIVSKENTTVFYTAKSLNFDPVPIQRFDIPASGYRILGFDESGKNK